MVEKCSVLDAGGKTQMGENPCNWVGNENPIHTQDSGLKQDSIRSPHSWMTQKETTNANLIPTLLVCIQWVSCCFFPNFRPSS